jgi:hypothetical protein
MKHILYNLFLSRSQRFPLQTEYCGTGKGFMVNDQRDAQFLSMYLFLTIYMFRAHRVYHQERETVSIQPLVAVSVCC